MTRIAAVALAALTLLMLYTARTPSGPDSQTIAGASAHTTEPNPSPVVGAQAHTTSPAGSEAGSGA